MAGTCWWLALLTKWGRDKITAVSRRHFQMHFHEWNVWISNRISLRFVSKGSIDNIPVFVKIIAWLVYQHIYAPLGLNNTALFHPYPPGSLHCQLYECTVYRSIGESALSLYSLCGKTNYRQIWCSIEAAWFDVIMIISPWNLTGISAALLPMSLLNFGAIENV